MKIKKVNEMKNSDNFIEWINNRSDKDEIIDILQLEGEEVSPNVYDFYGDMISGVKIDVDELEGFGTSCGRKDNTCFDNEIIDYLKESGVDYIVSTIFLNEPNKLGHCLIPFKNEKAARKFSKMIDARLGSLSSQGEVNDEYFFFETE